MNVYVFLLYAVSNINITYLQMNIILPLPINTSFTHTSLTPALWGGGFIFFTEKKKNIIIDGIFTKILYSTPYFTMTGLYIQFQICSKFLSDDTLKDNARTLERRSNKVESECARTPDLRSGVGVRGFACEDLSSKVIESVLNKTYLQFNPSVDKNKTQIESICEIETHILNVYSKTQLIHHTKTPIYGLKTQLYSGCIRTFSIDKPIFDNNNEDDTTPSSDMPFARTHYSTQFGVLTKYIKISGVWETDQAYGITYKVFTECMKNTIVM
jgi:hypothetical protein